MHCSDILLVTYSSYMFRRMYVMIREPSVMCPAELHEGAYGCMIYVKQSIYVTQSIHPVIIVNKSIKIRTVKSLHTDYITL
jgi:hypothetical protein